ncbi:MAG: hypothetical protein A3F67_10475 [Verrucomicrobia bacterium RIFCSPHIGHO2_12_FULL_41_10]|nr:MAG: hypothetical protein A3F67_10475 [Verrucomicrobia bacterium RIFCSPHIGHO2_12_FULL_41_10]
MEFVFALLFFLTFATLLWHVVQKKLAVNQEAMKESFKALSHEVTELNSRIFLELAKGTLERYQDGARVDLENRQKAIDGLLTPVKETMKEIDAHQREMEKVRASSYGSLSKQIDSLMEAQRDLRKETATLAQSLRSPHIRGSWGEIHLRRVVELAGLLNHCDFFEQKTIDIAGRIIRPDLIIRLPGQRQIAVDAKTPLNAFLEAADVIDEDLRKKKLQEHAVSLRKHMKELSAKEYWKQCDLSPEYVILFLPAESFFSAALQVDPSLIESGVDQNVLFATPTTLIAILRGIALSWKQENLSKSAREISQLGQDLYERIGIFCEHWNKVGRQLNLAVDSFNQSVASLESRVLVSARKLKETNQLQKELPDPSQIEQIARSLTSTE